MAALAAFGAVIAMTTPALAHQSAHSRPSTSTASLPATASDGGQTGLAKLAVRTAKMSCAQLSSTTSVSGQKVQVAQYQVGSSTPGAPQYCAMTGHINTYIGFEILLPIKTWRQRYLQIGCGGLCGSIGLDGPETTSFRALADGDFVVASQDEGHSGQGVDWYSNPKQRVDFAYLSDHDLARVAKGLAAKFYGLTPEYSYFDGCSQGASGAHRSPALPA